jgi:hypothetical protein
VSVPRALLLVLALLQATGLADAMQREVCAAECRGDGCDGDCMPGNDSPNCPCHCPAMQGLTAPSIEVVTLEPPSMGTLITFGRTERAHASPDPREILHVPRRTV